MHRVASYSRSRIAVRAVAAVLIAVLGTAACQSKPLISGPQIKSFLYEVQIGMTREDVISRLGEPADRLTIEDTEFLFYYTDWINTPNAVERSPFAVKEGKVIAMGKTYYEDFLKVRNMYKNNRAS